jgi:Fe-S-cluster containining protein
MSHTRREMLTEYMLANEKAGNNCYSCKGGCCTFEMNSMQTTPLETYELFTFLNTNNRINDELTAKLNETISWYRLDKPIPSDGKREFARRTYTCPFLEPGDKGCTISRASKPYGCLGFNPDIKDSVGERGCSSNQGLLEKREKLNSEFEVKENNRLKEKFNLSWDKLPMPVALLKMIKNN